jgi:hypothetical protein
MILARLNAHIPSEEILDRFMALLNLPSHGETLLSFIRIEKNLEKEIKEGVAQGHLSVPVAESLLELKDDARRHIFRCIRELKFNMNQQRKLIDLLNDIAHAEKRSISEILEEESVKAIRSDQRMNNPQKAKALIEFLRSRRLPSLVRAEKIFRRQASRLNLPSGTRLVAPPFFEGPYYRLEVSFKNGKELKEKIVRLSQTEEIQDLNDPWDKDM